jgi:ATP phosphoribosyltransferase
MLKIAIPNKGSLSEGAVELLREAGYKCKRRSRELVVVDKKNNVEFIFLRPRDIAVYVASGVINLGITGRDLVVDSLVNVDELLPLNFGNSSFYYAVPKESDLTPEQFKGIRIASSYDNLVKLDMKKKGIDAIVTRLDGAIEISVKLGVADVIADVVSTGKTLEEAGLKVVGEPLLISEAILIGLNKDLCDDAKKMIQRLQGILLARTYVMVEYDIPEKQLSAACELTPGIESPTISPLAEKEWLAVKSMVKNKDINTIMDGLEELGAKGIFVTEMKTCRL